MEIWVAGHRLYGYKWCCQNKIIIVLIRKLFSIGPTLPLKIFHPLMCFVFHDASCVFPASSSVVHVLIQLLFCNVSPSDPGTCTTAADGFFY